MKRLICLLALLVAFPAHAERMQLSPSGLTSLSGDCTTTAAGAAPIVCTKSNGRLTSVSMYVPTANQVMASTSDVSCFSGTGSGSKTIAANTAYVGQTFQLTCSGWYTTPGLNTATLTAKIKWGSTVISSVTTPAFPSSANNLPFYATVLCTVISTGATGSMGCFGGLYYVTGLTGASYLFASLGTASPTTINTTTSNALDGTGAWSSVAGGQTATVTSGAILQVN